MKHFLVLACIVFQLTSCSKDNPPPILSEVGNEETEEVAVNKIPCKNGMAGVYPCSGYDLLGTVSLETLSARSGNDVWGWTDPDTGKEYAIMGVDNGTAFVDISNPDNLRYLGKLPTATVSSTWRDVKVYQNFAYIVAESRDHGVQVFDLTQLRNLKQTPIEFTATNRYTGIGNAHNIVINQSTSFAYPVGTNRTDSFSGGVHFLNLQNPANPIANGGWGENGYTHDAQVISYTGPDTDYAGAELFLGANESEMVVVDITEKDAPRTIATIDYPFLHYTHQGWFTEDQRYFILGDELDEVNAGFRSRTLVFDMTDLDAPILHHTYLGPTSAIDHNGYVLEDTFFLANYTAGVRMINVSNIAAKEMTEIGFFDTYPANDNTQFDGVWSVYPYFKSGNILVSDINRGLFVIRKSDTP